MFSAVSDGQSSDEKSESLTLKFTQCQVNEVATVSSIFIDHFWRPAIYRSVKPCVSISTFVLTFWIL